MDMDTTRGSLLVRLRDRSDDQAWRDFRTLYAPLLYRYARARGLGREDAEEVRDQCLEVVAREMPDFEYDKQKGGFQNWLRRIAGNKVIDLLRKRRERIADTKQIRAVRDPGPSPEELWEQNWHHEHLKFCVERIRDSVSEINYRAFQMLLFEDRSVKEVCTRLGITPNQVYKGRNRILQRVRRMMAEFD